MPHREILLVEDDGIIAAHLELSLRRMGYTVAGIAGSGEEALAMAAALRDSAERLRSMALVHEQLYGSRDLARIDIAMYLTDLTRGLYSVFGARDSVVVVVSAEEVWVGVDTAIPCGLIVNELVSNALKYAFPAGRSGRVTVGFEVTPTLEGARRVVLCVGDDGVGLPEGLDAARTASLGLRLVHILARQLGGAVTVSRGEGTRFEIAFREKDLAHD